jgi:hypothetical protein
MATKDILRIRVYHRRNYANKLKAQEQKARRGTGGKRKRQSKNRKLHACKGQMKGHALPSGARVVTFVTIGQE